jgi:uncharacterized coiled-coil protein SlyX
MGTRTIKRKAAHGVPKDTEAQLRELLNKVSKANVDLQKTNALLENEASTVLEELVTGMKQLQDAVNNLGERVIKLEEQAAKSTLL